MKVHTYFEPLGLNDAEALLPLWKEAWSRAGFEPVVLGPEDIRPADQPYRAWFEKHYPTVNAAGYDAACYMRWFAALDAVRGGSSKRILVVDTDVFPNRDVTDRGFSFGAGVPELLFLEPNRVPCAIWATDAGLIEFIDALLEGPVVVDVGGRPHCSDMTICQTRFFPHGRYADLCLEYGAEGWERAEFIHFPHSRVGPNKADVIKKILC